MIMFFLIIFVVAMATVFSVQNAVPVTVSFLAWRFSASLAVLIFLSILAGMLIASLFWFSIRLGRSLPKKGTGLKEAESRGKSWRRRSDPAESRPL